MSTTLSNNTTASDDPSRLFPHLDLPGPELFHAYGASLALSEYCSIDLKMIDCSKIIWQHGWISERRTIHPALVTGGYREYSDLKENTLFLVARSDHKELLLANGYKKVHAIGLPITYTQAPLVTRTKGSLLVMPVHSLAETDHQWQFREYANFISQMKSEFRDITVCIHPTCKAKNYWHPEFERLGFRIISGASGGDANSLKRIAHIMSSHEFMTTNGYGSHLVYGALFGAKVSIAGPYARFEEEDYRRTPLYVNVPEILGPSIYTCREEIVRQDYPFLFVEPMHAKQEIEWGAKECGLDRKQPRKEILRILSIRNQSLKGRLRQNLRNSAKLARGLCVNLAKKLRRLKHR